MHKRVAAIFYVGLTFGLVLTETNAYGEVCDPNKILRENVSSYRSDTLVWLAYVSNTIKTKTENSAQGAGVSYAGIGLSWDDARSLSEFVGTNQNFRLSQQQSVSILRSTLAEDSVRAYIACLNSDLGAAIVVPDAALGEELFQLSVQWYPRHKILPGPHELMVRVTNGKIVDDSGIESDILKVNIDPNDKKPFTITRNLDKTLFISAFVDGQSDVVSLPARPQFALKLKTVNTKYDELLRDVQHGQSLVTRDQCVTAEPDSILVPSTMKFVGQTYGPAGRALTPVSTATNTGVMACGQFIASEGCNEADCASGIKGQFSVVEAYTEMTKK